MIINYKNLITNMDELSKIDRTDPNQVVGAFINILCTYENNQDEFYKLFQYLLGEFQPISNLTKQNIKDRMTQNNKYPYIGKSYFIGATPENDYTPTEPYQIEIIANEYTDENEGYKRLFIKSGGADTERPIILRLAKDGNYYIWSDSYMGLLADIRKPESTNPWA